jgi:aminomethyltransferase
MTLLRTPLHSAHVRLGARMVEFGGWDMPVQYAGLVEEHATVRTAAGLFDVSHMGEFVVEGPGALELLQRLTPNDVSALKIGRIHYTSFLTDRGTFVDDLLVYRLGDERFMIVANAGNKDKDFAWLEDGLRRLGPELPGPATARDDSDEVALIAVQGPLAAGIVSELWRGPAEAKDMKYYSVEEGGELAGRPVRFVSRTGYTGEDGFEIGLDNEHAEAAWDALLARGAKPAGLGARDTLRLEAGMCLYGNDIDDTTTPIEAGLEWTVKAGKGEFAGRSVLARQLEEGTSRKLTGLEITGRGIARHGHEVHHGGEPVGIVTSGTHSPTLQRPIAMAYVPRELCAPGTELTVDVRGRQVEARTCPLPFYSRKKK